MAVSTHTLYARSTLALSASLSVLLSLRRRILQALTRLDSSALIARSWWQHQRGRNLELTIFLCSSFRKLQCSLSSREVAEASVAAPEPMPGESSESADQFDRKHTAPCDRTSSSLHDSHLTSAEFEIQVIFFGRVQDPGEGERGRSGTTGCTIALEVPNARLPSICSSCISLRDS